MKTAWKKFILIMQADKPDQIKRCSDRNEYRKFRIKTEFSCDWAGVVHNFAAGKNKKPQRKYAK